MRDAVGRAKRREVEGLAKRSIELANRRDLNGICVGKELKAGTDWGRKGEESGERVSDGEGAGIRKEIMSAKRVDRRNCGGQVSHALIKRPCVNGNAGLSLNNESPAMLAQRA